MRKNTRRTVVRTQTPAGVRGLGKKRRSYEQFNFVLTREERRMLDKIAEKELVSASHAVRTLIRERFQQIEAA